MLLCLVMGKYKRVLCLVVCPLFAARMINGQGLVGVCDLRGGEEVLRTGPCWQRFSQDNQVDNHLDHLARISHLFWSVCYRASAAMWSW